MELIVVGCSGSVSGPASPASAYLVQAPYEGRTFTLLLDLGPGAFGALYSYLDPAEVDAVALSHLHPDHCLDLCGFFVAARYSPSAPWARRPLYGPPGTQSRLARAYQVPGDEEDPRLGETFDFRDWQPEQGVGPFTVGTAPMDHLVEAVAIRVTERRSGASLVYSGDTGPCPALVDLARGADLLLAEAAHPDVPGLPGGLHLTGRQAGEHAAAAGVGRLLLTHVPAWVDAEGQLASARTAFPGAELVGPRATYDV